MDMDCSYTLLGQHLGANRSPLRSLDAIAALVDAIQRSSKCPARERRKTDHRGRAHPPMSSGRLTCDVCFVAHVQLVGVMGYEVRVTPSVHSFSALPAPAYTLTASPLPTSVCAVVSRRKSLACKTPTRSSQRL